eukprot:scaffold7215_cov366-Prasinococcus_capsulatus_cf.AAC.1
MALCTQCEGSTTPLGATCSCGEAVAHDESRLDRVAGACWQEQTSAQHCGSEVCAYADTSTHQSMVRVAEPSQCEFCISSMHANGASHSTVPARPRRLEGVDYTC